jgi:spore coat polysaccharide biosynthesis predicted glycosyltransferase SpsG
MVRAAELLNEYLALGVTLTVFGRPVATNRHLPLLEWIEDENAFYTRLSEDLSPLVIIDLHPEHCNLQVIRDVLSHRKDQDLKTVVMDKLTCLAENADWAYVPSFFTKHSQQKVSYGWDHYLLTPPSPQAHDEKKQQISIFTGGSDIHQLGKTLPKLLNNLTLPHWDIIWVQGPLADTPELGQNSQIKLIADPVQGLADIMASSAIVLTLYGNTFFEALHNGAASILLPPADCCELELAKLREEEVCWIAQSLEDAIDALSQLTKSPELLRDYQNRGLHQLKHANGQAFIKGVDALLKN